MWLSRGKVSGCGNRGRSHVRQREALGGDRHGRRCSAAGGPRPTPGSGLDGLGWASALRVSGAAPLGSSSEPRLDNEKSPLPWISFGLCLGPVCHAAREAVGTRQATGMNPGTTSGDTAGLWLSVTLPCAASPASQDPGAAGKGGALTGAAIRATKLHTVGGCLTLLTHGD